MLGERCAQCGFDGDRWTDVEAIAAVAALSDQWGDAVSAMSADQLLHRPIPEMWSIAEYADHVREVLFSMRFLLEIALTQPSTDLGEPPKATFAPEPRSIDIALALSGVESEARQLVSRLAQLAGGEWDSSVTVGGEQVDARWIVRHAVHDATHHLGDIELLRNAF